MPQTDRRGRRSVHFRFDKQSDKLEFTTPKQHPGPSSPALWPNLHTYKKAAFGQPFLFAANGKFQFIVLLQKEKTITIRKFRLDQRHGTISRPTAIDRGGKAQPQHRKCAPGGVWGGGLPCGSKALNSLPSRILWVLSWRNKKGPPPAGTGSNSYEGGYRKVP